MANNLRLERGLVWTTAAPSARELENAGYFVLDYARLVRDYIEPAEALGMQRPSLDAAAAPLLALFDAHRAVAVLRAPVSTAGDLQRLYSYIVEPAYRRDCTLLIQAGAELDDLQPERFVDPLFGYAWTLQRLQHLAARYRRRSIDAALPPMTPIEEDLLTAMRAVGLSPQVQYGIGRYRADFAFPDRGLAVEADGRAWHDAARDRRRDERLTAMGWRVVRFTGSRINREPALCAEEVLQLYHARPELPVYSAVGEVEARPSFWRRLSDWLKSLFRRSAAASEEADAYDGPGETNPAPRPWRDSLDPAQRAAVTAHEGVVQVLAPAGSGKTRVLVARVQELLSQGIPAERILCTTFNSASRTDMKERLQQVTADAVTIHTFHSLGRHILEQEKRLRAATGTLSYNQWRRLAGVAKGEAEGRIWIDAPEANEAVSSYKLVSMIDPQEAARRASTPFEKTAARIYELYEAALAEQDRNDFDDLILNAVRLLQTDEAVRRRWQEKWECVLVDEYQDIELAQELLVQMLAAPEDCLLVVGDEDQCIYTWRRAEVERIIHLDKRYAGLQRTVLATCYRCPPDVVAASSRLIAHNRNRFPKNTVAGRRGGTAGAIALLPAEDPAKAAKQVAQSLSGSDPNETVVLARTTRLLRIVALACVAAHVPFRASDKVLKGADSEQTLLSYLRLLANSRKAASEDVRSAFRVPNRYLADGQEEEVARRLRAGSSFAAALGQVRGEDWRRSRLDEGAALLDRLAQEPDSQKVIHTLRTEGGLDKYYSDQERMSAHDQINIEMLDVTEEESRGRQLGEVVRTLEERTQLLTAAVSEEGVELATIHGAKGREWNRVIVFGFDDDQLPHQRVSENPRKPRQAEPRAQETEEREAQIEDERRLAYVAMTRAKARLEIVYTDGNPSRFLEEADLLKPDPDAAPAAQTANAQPAAGGVRVLAAETPGLNRAAGRPARPAAGPAPIQYRAVSKPMPSRYAATCRACGDYIVVGQMICKAECNGSEAWVHDRCAVR